MFEIAELGQQVSKKEYKEQLPALRIELLRVQQELKRAKFAVMIVLAGMEGAGKGDSLHTLHDWLDPRYLQANAFDTPTDEEEERPHFWRFWRRLPPHGRMGVFLNSWYMQPLLRRFEGTTDTAQHQSAMKRINQFEEELANDGTLILKFWFHLSKKAQKKRLMRLERDPDTRWRVSPLDWKLHKQYDQYRTAAEQTLRLTGTGESPWVIVDGSDPRFRNLTVGRHLAAAIGRRLKERQIPSQNHMAPMPNVSIGPRISVLDNLDLNQSLSKEEYQGELKKLQGKLHLLCRKSAKKGIATMLAFEGWDAAGKGGIIRRLVGGMDARHFTIHPIAAPSDEELARHYLWRFWRHLPRAGRVAIFDRSWYGRVLVERVEGFAAEHEWRRAYKEINDFEQQICEHGTLLMKFWVHIDKDEQLRRFQEREKTPFKRYKITEDDYRNRQKWDAYDQAVNEMIERCSTDFAPFVLVEANDKRFARIKVLSHVCDWLEERLGK